MALRLKVWVVTATISMIGPVAAVDWTDVPIVEDGACEFQGALWTNGTAKRHGLRNTDEMQAFGIRRAQERCRNGMVLLISSLHSGAGPTVEPTLNVARALCRVPDIQQTVRPSIENYTITDVRCTISKLPQSVSIAPGVPPPDLSSSKTK